VTLQFLGVVVLSGVVWFALFALAQRREQRRERQDLVEELRRSPFPHREVRPK
jgi:preprotein translocase subunit YajC